MTFDEWVDRTIPMTASEENFAWLAWNAATIAEREACAAECERMMMYPGGQQESAAHNNVWEAARAIRMRSTATN